MSAMRTPGPWTYDGNKLGIVKQASNGVLAVVYGDVDANGDELDVAPMQANAHMVAAAPDLAKALQRWQKYAIDNGWTDADFHDADGTGWLAATNAALEKAGVK